MPAVSVCLATFKRNERLSAVLEDLARQDRLPDQVVIVDNDPAAGARATVRELDPPIPSGSTPE
jgi:succinoglycan biosynthesis protein ExoM